MKLFGMDAAPVVGYLTFLTFFVFSDRLSSEVLGLNLATIPLTILFLVMLWGAFSVVRHAECLASLLGEPYGTLILTLAVISIEVTVIIAIMLSGADKPTLARDTMFSVLMIVLNGLVGLCLIVGGLRHKNQIYNLQGANAYLAVLLPLAVLGLVLPKYTSSLNGGLSPLNMIFLICLSVALYFIFLAVQTITHSDIFTQPYLQDAASHQDDHHNITVKNVPFHVFGLLFAMIPIVLLSKPLGSLLNYELTNSGAPLALGGFLVAALILTPEALSAVYAARDNKLQRAVNIALGSALATICLTIPAVLTISVLTNAKIILGLGEVNTILLALTLAVNLVTFISQRTNFLLGAVHLALFITYIVMIFDNTRIPS